MAVRIYVEKFASYTTMHGFPRIIASKATPKRLAWIIVFTTAWLFFVIHSSFVLSSYFKYPKKTTTEIVSGGVPFPDITLCNHGSFDFYTVYRLSKGFDAFEKKNDNEEHGAVKEELDLRRYFGMEEEEEYDDTTFYLNDTFIRAMHKYYDVLNETNIKNNSYYKALYDTLLSRITLAATMPTNILSAHGVREKEFVVKCTFRNEPCTFKKRFDPYFFNCFTFTPPNVTLSSSGEYPPLLKGIDNGFSVTLLAGTRMLENEIPNPKHLRLPGIYAGDNPMSGAGGVRVVIHPRGSKPYPMTEGYDVPPERMATLGINLARRKRLGQPYGHCRQDYPFTDDPERQRLAGPYSRKTCEKVCIQHFGIRRECNCTENTLPAWWDIAPENVDYRSLNETLNEEYLNHKAMYDTCLTNQWEEPYNYTALCERMHKCSGIYEFQNCFGVFSDKPPKCDNKVFENLVKSMECAENVKNRLMANATFLTNCGCYPACDNALYDVSYSLSQWPSHGIDGETIAYEIMKEINFTARFTPEEKRKFYDDYRLSDLRKAMRDFSKINVFVADSDVFLTTEEPAMTVTDLISDMGGQLGVWIGVSVLTLAEVLEILIVMVIDCCRKRFAKPNKADADLNDVAIGDV